MTTTVEKDQRLLQVLTIGIEAEMQAFLADCEVRNLSPAHNSDLPPFGP
jgi:hypothetical protein